jgi:hypothetical protein
MDIKFSHKTRPQDFDIQDYIKAPYHLNKKRSTKIYYRCKHKRSGCISTCRVDFAIDFLSAVINVEGEHNHPLADSKTRISKTTTKIIDDLLFSNPHEKPSIIQKHAIKKIEESELDAEIPTAVQISRRKSKLLDAAFPTPDHMWNVMISHGQFDGASKFVRFFSLFPLVLVMATDAMLSTLSNSHFITYIDGTHSTCSPTMSLLCILCQKSKSSQG